MFVRILLLLVMHKENRKIHAIINNFKYFMNMILIFSVSTSFIIVSTQLLS